MVKVLAVASSGGHWDQLMMLRDVFDANGVRYATTDVAQADAHDIADAHQLPDCNLNQPLRSLLCLFSAFWLVLRLQPRTIITTGAAPGLFCIIFGRLIGSRTLWIDSLANADQLSLSGRIAQRIAHASLTQWEHLAKDSGPHYAGSLL